VECESRETESNEGETLRRKLEEGGKKLPFWERTFNPFLSRSGRSFYYQGKTFHLKSLSTQKNEMGGKGAFSRFRASS